MGGPIVKNKAFFFASVEALQQRAGINLIATVPSVYARARAVPSIRPLLDAFPIGQQPLSNPDLELRAATRVLPWMSITAGSGSITT